MVYYCYLSLVNSMICIICHRSTSQMVTFILHPAHNYPQNWMKKAQASNILQALFFNQQKKKLTVAKNFTVWMQFQFKMPEICKYTFWPISKADHRLVGRNVQAVGFHSLQCLEIPVVVEASIYHTNQQFYFCPFFVCLFVLVT